MWRQPPPVIVSAVGGTANRSVAFQVGLRPPWGSGGVHCRVIGSPEIVATAYTSMRVIRFTFLRSLADKRVTSSTLYAMVDEAS
jgi:hypothetical protein